MALLGTSFNVAQMPQSNDYDALPAGNYDCRIANAELCTTKAGNGQYIKVRYDIVGPSHEGRVVFGNINISNPNPKAEEIGHQQLGQLMKAVGLTEVNDTDQLIGHTLNIKLAVKDDLQYGASNEVKGFKAVAGSKAPAPVNKPAAQAPVQEKPPWMR